MDLQEAFDQGFEAVKGYVDRSLASQAKRMAALERAIADMARKAEQDNELLGLSFEKVRDGLAAVDKKVADVGDLRKDIGALSASVHALPKPEPVDFAAMLKEATADLARVDAVGAMFAEAAAATQKAVDAQEDKMAALVGETVERAVAALPVPQDGKDADPEQIAALVKQEAERILATWERPKDGNDGPTAEAVKAMVEQSVEAAIARLPKAKDGDPGKDGLGLASSMIDRDGNLVATMTDGTTRNLGRVVGKDVDMVLVEGMVDAAMHKAIAEAVAALPKAKDGEPGKSVTVDDVAPMILAQGEKLFAEASKGIPDAVKAAVAALPPAVPGKDADPSVIQRMVEEAVAAIPRPKDGEPGKSVELWQVTAMVADQVKLAVDALPKPKDGVDVDPAVVKATIAEEVRKAVTAIEKPVDGHSPTADEYGPLIEEAVQRAVAAMPKAKDGVGVAGALIDNKGALVLTLSDGTTRDLGKIVGRDGEDVDKAAVERLLKEMFDAWPKPRDGADGIGFDDVQQEIEDEGRFIVQRWLKDGAVVREIRLQTKAAIWRGVYDANRTYLPGDLATWKGSVWHCNKEVAGKIGSESWSLAVKAGRDGKDGGQS